MTRAMLAVLFLLSLAGAQPPSPETPATLLRRGIDAAKAGRTGEAVRTFQEVLRGGPPREVAGQARLELLRIYERRGDLWAAAGQLRELRKLAPGDPEYAYMLGVVYRNLAKSAYEQMRAVGPDSALFQQLLGEQLSAGGETGKAVSAFQKAITADPKLAGPHLALSIIYLRMNKPSEALAEVDQELAISPESAVARQVRQAITGAKP